MRFILVILPVLFLFACGGGSGGGNEGSNVTPPPSSGGGSEPEIKATILSGPFLNLDNETIPEIEVIDINDDGLKDILLSVTDYGTNNTFKVLVNQGDKNFVDQTAQFFPAQNNPSLESLPFWISQFYFVDLNNDGLKDLIAGTSNPGMGEIDRIFMQQEDNTFAELPLSIFEPFDFTYNNGEIDSGHTLDGSFLPVDVDGDGDYDLVNLDASHGVIPDDNGVIETNILEIRVYLNESVDGAVSFIKSQNERYKDFSIDKAAFIDNPAIVDINHDGFNDIVYFGPKWKGTFVNEQVELKVLLNDGKGVFSSGVEHVIEGDVPTLIHGNAHTLGDFNNDGTQDILIGGSGYDAPPFDGERNVLLLSQSNGLYLDAKKGAEAFIGDPIMTHSTAVGDINSDGHLDIVFANVAKGGIDDKVKLLLNDGSANFEVQQGKFPNGALYGEQAELNAWTSVRVADMDNDGKNDIILGAQFYNTNSIIYWNDGSGVFK